MGRIKKFIYTSLMIMVGLCAITMSVKAADFVKRNTPPSSSSVYYASNNGYSGYSMPNCTAYVYGRLYELTGTKPTISHNNADTIYSYNKSKGIYGYSADPSSPRVGAIICFTTSGVGHVGIVEEIGSDSGGKYICVSESNYSARTSGNEWKAFNYVKYYLSGLNGYTASNGNHAIKLWYIEDNDGYTEPSNNDGSYAIYATFEGYVYAYDGSTGSGSTTSIQLQDTGVTNLTDTSARINATLNPASNVSSCGFYWGTSSSNLTKVEENVAVNGCKTIWYDLGTGKWTGTLSPGTTYYYQMYVVINGTTYKSNVSSFKTTKSYSLELEAASSITDTTAYIKAKLPNRADITECGFYYGTSQSNMTQVREVASVADCASIYYTLGTGKWTPALSKNTTYYYQMYAVIGGATYKSNVGSFTTTGQVPLTGFTLNSTSLSLLKGKTSTLSVTSYTPANTTSSKTATWKSSNTAVATVSSSGVVTAVGKGSATITCTVAGVSKTCTVTVTPITYTVSYNANGGSGVPSNQTKEQGVTLTLSTTKPTRTGYNFLGWSTSSTATSAQYAAGGSFTTDSNTTLYAVWAKQTYAVSYNANGGSGAPAAQTKTYGQALTLSTTKPTRTGYNFLGWSTSSTATSAEYAPGASYTKDSAITLYAVWAKKTYTVSYDANGGSGAPASQTKTHGQALTLSTTKPTRTGYNFFGWSTSSNASSIDYLAGGSYTVDGSATLYAVWMKQEYTISYDANGGSGAPEAQSKRYDESLTLRTTIPTRDGYKFLGWATSSTATSAEYTAGANYTGNGTITLFAVWELDKLSTITGTVTSSIDTSGVTIELIPAGATEAAYSVTSTDGTYDIADIANGTYTLRASKANHVSREYEVTVADGNLELNVELCPIGDVSGDGNISVADYVKVLAAAKGTATLDAYARKCADVNADQNISVVDYVKILSHTKGATRLW